MIMVENRVLVTQIWNQVMNFRTRSEYQFVLQIAI